MNVIEVLHPIKFKKVEHGNVILSVVNVWIQQGGNYMHCNLFPVHYSCYIMGFAESCITVCIANYIQVVCHKMYQVFLVLVLLLISFAHLKNLVMGLSFLPIDSLLFLFAYTADDSDLICPRHWSIVLSAGY